MCSVLCRISYVRSILFTMCMPFKGGDGVRYPPLPVGRLEVEYFDVVRCPIFFSGPPW